MYGAEWLRVSVHGVRCMECGADCIKSLRSFYMGLYPQMQGAWHQALNLRHPPPSPSLTRKGRAFLQDQFRSSPMVGVDRPRVGWLNGFSFIASTGACGVPREQKMLKGHLPRVIYHQVYEYTKIKESNGPERPPSTSTRGRRTRGRSTRPSTSSHKPPRYLLLLYYSQA